MVSVMLLVSFGIPIHRKHITLVLRSTALKIIISKYSWVARS